jgi:hypothetical protein
MIPKGRERREGPGVGENCVFKTSEHSNELAVTNP